MTRTTIVVINEGEKNESKKPGQVLIKMSDGVESASQSNSHEENNESVHKTEQQQSREGILTSHHPIHAVSVQYDLLDEISNKSVGAKATNKSRDGSPQISYSRADNVRQHPSPTDVRCSSVGNGNDESKWHASERFENGPTDSINSKWQCLSDKSDLKGNGNNACNSSESDLFTSKGLQPVNNTAEFTAGRPNTLFKSSSSSQIPHPKGNGTGPAGRQLKFGGNGSGKLTSVLAMSQSYVPYPAPNPLYGRNYCSCSGNCGKRSNRTESSLSLTENVETPEGLSWRRLHMSRAKLKATATTSELLSGFAMVAMVELQINKPTAVPEWLFVLFAVCTTILVSVHIFALMISTYLLPNIDAVSKLHVSSLVTESPHDRMKSFIELAWAFSTILGLFLFLVEIAILCWVKFWDYSFTAAMSATMIVIPVLILFVAFAIHFYHSLVVIKCKTSVSNMQELENMKRQLDNVLSP